MLAPLLALVLGAGAEILLPPWPLSPDGDLVAVRGAAALEVRGGTAAAIAPGLFRVVPAAGAGEVALSAGEARRTAAVAPPPGRVAIAVSPPAPVKGRDAEVALAIEVRTAAGELDPAAPAPVLVASTGAVGGLAPDGPGRFRATWAPSPARFPEVAIVVALVPRCPTCPTPRAAGGTAFPVQAAIDLPGWAEPGARTTVELAGRRFGPAVADARGRFTLPLVVPPGAGPGVAVAVDRLGNTRRTPVDLRLPPVRRLACLAWPAAVPADGEAEVSVHCLAATADGAPDPGARLEAAAAAGAVGPFEPGPGGLARARYRAPSGGAGQDPALAVAFAGGGTASREAVPLRLSPGPPVVLEVELAREPVPLGGGTPARAVVRDVRGDPVGLAAGPPGAAAGFVAPERYVSRTAPADAARAAAAGWREEAPLAFAVAPGAEAATLSLRREGGAWVAAARTADGGPAVGVPVRFGSGAEVATDARGEARAAGGPAEWAVAEGGARAAGWAGFEPPPAPIAVARTVEVALRPASPVDVMARVEGGVLRWRVEDAEGHALPGRAVALRARGVALGPAEPDAEGGRAAVRGGGGAVAVVDLATGVAAVVDVP